MFVEGGCAEAKKVSADMASGPIEPVEPVGELTDTDYCNVEWFGGALTAELPKGFADIRCEHSTITVQHAFSRIFLQPREAYPRQSGGVGG